MYIFMLIAFVSGLFLSNQSPINARLGQHVNSPFIAASASFTLGTLFLGLITWFQLGYLFPSHAFVTSQPLWIWAGGLLGGIFLTSNILLFPKIGAVKTVVLPLVGQILTGIAIDTFGLFGATPTPFSLVQLIGIVIMFVGLFLTVLTKKTPAMQTNTTTASNTFWMVWAVVIGMFSAMQQAINGRLGALLHSPVQGAFLSFGIGMVLIIAVTVFMTRDWPTVTTLKKVEPWAYFGGILGALFVLTTVISVPQIGTGLTIMIALVGQLIGSILVQQFGFWHANKAQVKAQQIIGILIMLVGITIIKFIGI